MAESEQSPDTTPATSSAEKEKTKRLIIVIVTILVLLFGTFVWPTPYNYETVTKIITVGTRSRTTSKVIKINRFTGETVVVHNGY